MTTIFTKTTFNTTDNFVQERVNSHYLQCQTVGL